jgi:hypothetical protein
VVGESGRPYEFVVEYRYDAGREWLTSTRWSSKEATFERMDDVQRLAHRYRVATRTVCWRNPDDPREVMLERQSLLFAGVLLFPLIFVVVGAGGIWAVWSKARPGDRPISERAAASGAGTGCLRMFFLVFLIVGAVVLWMMTLGPLLRIAAARSWVPTPCLILSSRVIAHTDSDGSSYRVDILFAYTFDGVERQSSRYDFSRGSSSGYATKAAVVGNYPAGAETTCYVNPRDPAEGPYKALAFGAIGLVFFLVGLFGVLGARRLTGGAPRASAVPQVRASGSGPVVLQPQRSRVAKFIFMLIFAAVWNGFIGTFFYLAVVRDARSPLAVKIFLGFFLLCGIGLACAAVYQFLALFNPRVRLTASGAAAPLGGTLRVEWTVEGRAARLRRLRIVFEGREEATYRRGTTTSTDTKLFFTLPLLDTEEGDRIAAGHAELTVPADSMHTFEARNNKVLWRLMVRGEVPRWPDVEEEFPVTVLPQIATTA